MKTPKSNWSQSWISVVIQELKSRVKISILTLKSCFKVCVVELEFENFSCNTEIKGQGRVKFQNFTEIGIMFWNLLRSQNGTEVGKKFTLESNFSCDAEVKGQGRVKFQNFNNNFIIKFQNFLWSQTGIGILFWNLLRSQSGIDVCTKLTLESNFSCDVGVKF